MDKEHVEQEERDAHAHGEQRDLLGQAVELTLQGALGLLHVLREARDLAELGRHADARDHDAAVALGDRGAGKDEVGGFGGGEVGLAHGVGGLPHGVGLAGQGRLVDLEVGGADHAAVGRDLVALREDHDVAGDEVLREDLDLLAVTDDVDVGGEHLLEGLGRLVGLVLLPEAEAAVDEVDQPNGDAQLRHAGDERDDAGDPQKDRHEVREVGEKRQYRGLFLCSLNEVLSELALVLCRLLAREACRAGGQGTEHFVGGECRDVGQLALDGV